MKSLCHTDGVIQMVSYRWCHTDGSVADVFVAQNYLGPCAMLLRAEAYTLGSCVHVAAVKQRMFALPSESKADHNRCTSRGISMLLLCPWHAHHHVMRSTHYLKPVLYCDPCDCPGQCYCRFPLPCHCARPPTSRHAASKWMHLVAELLHNLRDGLQVPFGRPLRQEFFHLKNTFLNAGSYGATPKPVLKARKDWEMVAQSSPYQWFWQVSLLGSQPPLYKPHHRCLVPLPCAGHPTTASHGDPDHCALQALRGEGQPNVEAGGRLTARQPVASAAQQTPCCT